MLSSPRTIAVGPRRHRKHKVREICLTQYSAADQTVPSHSTKDCFRKDWILFPAISSRANQSVVASVQTLTLEALSSSSSKRGLARTLPVPKTSNDTCNIREAYHNDSFIRHNAGHKEMFDAIHESPQRRQPSRPSPRRLPTPDIEELEESRFVDCCTKAKVTEAKK